MMPLPRSCDPEQIVGCDLEIIRPRHPKEWAAPPYHIYPLLAGSVKYALQPVGAFGMTFGAEFIQAARRIR
jgi:hypothetical protein